MSPVYTSPLAVGEKGQNEVSRDRAYQTEFRMRNDIPYGYRITAVF
jgi:hypothetical protein